MALAMEALRTSKMLVNIRQTAWRSHTEDGHLQFLHDLISEKLLLN
jgi:hypothetical protein